METNPEKYILLYGYETAHVHVNVSSYNDKYVFMIFYYKNTMHFQIFIGLLCDDFRFESFSDDKYLFLYKTDRYTKRFFSNLSDFCFPDMTIYKFDEKASLEFMNKRIHSRDVTKKMYHYMNKQLLSIEFSSFNEILSFYKKIVLQKTSIDNKELQEILYIGGKSISSVIFCILEKFVDFLEDDTYYYSEHLVLTLSKEKVERLDSYIKNHNINDIYVARLETDGNNETYLVQTNNQDNLIMLKLLS